MGFKLGSSNVNKVYVGSTEATKVYLGSTQIYPSGAYDPDAQAFITAVATLTTPQEVAVNDLVLALKSASLWSKIYCYYPNVGGTASAHKWNLKDPRDLDAAYRLLFYGGMTHNANGFTGNGTNAYADTKLIPSSVMIQDDTAMVYVSGTNSGANSVEIGVANAAANPRILLNTRWSSGEAASDMYNTLTGRVVQWVADGSGIFIATRTSSSVHKLFRNGVQIGSTNTGASGSLSGANVSAIINAYKQGGTLAFYSSKNCKGAGLLKGLTDADVANLNTAIQNFNTALGR